MAQFKQKEPITLEEAFEILKNQEIFVSQKITFNCSRCGQSSIRRYDKKYFNMNKPLCAACGKKEKFKEKYGVENPSNLPGVVDKRRQTCLDRYGVDNYAKTKECLEKTRKTCQEKYGVDNYNKTSECREKIKKTNIERYGHPIAFGFGTKEYRDNLVEKYGVTNPMYSEEFKEKMKAVRKEKYSVDNFFQNRDILDKAIKANKKYIQSIRNSADYIEGLRDLIKDRQFEILKENFIEDELNFELRCLNCNNVFIYKKLKNPYPTCSCRKSVSSAEIEIAEFLESLNLEIERNNRTILNGKELDIFVPDWKIAIEYDGLYWHRGTSGIEKYNMYQEKGIRLIRILENEWLCDKEKIKDYLRATFNIFEKRIFARKCIIKDISSADYRSFCQDNHLQGFKNSSIRKGLYYDNELVQVIGVSSRNGTYELDRECSKRNYNIIGGKAKLLASLDIPNLVSFCDKSKFSGMSYFKSFSLEKETKPGYFYISIKGEKYSRLQCQKHKLKNFLKKFDDNISEEDNMFMNGFYKIYDYGNFKFVRK